MTKFCGYNNHNNILLMLLAALIFASMIVNSQCRLIATKEIQEEDDDLEMKWVLEKSSRDEIVQLAGYGEEKLSTILITGAIVCNKACLGTKHSSHSRFQHPPQPISGALVGVACHTNKKDKRLTWAKVVTDNYGDFIIDLPSHLHAIPNLDKACSVKVLKLPKNSPCHESAFVGNHNEIKLASVGNGIRTYTTGRMEIMHTLAANSEGCMEGQKNEQELSW